MIENGNCWLMCVCCNLIVWVSFNKHTPTTSRAKEYLPWPWNWYSLWLTPPLYHHSMLPGALKLIQMSYQGILVRLQHWLLECCKYFSHSVSWGIEVWLYKKMLWPMTRVNTKVQCSRALSNLDCSAFSILRCVIFQWFNQYLPQITDVSATSLDYWLSLSASLLRTYFGDLDTTEWPPGSTTHSEFSCLWMIWSTSKMISWKNLWQQGVSVSSIWTYSSIGKV